MSIHNSAAGAMCSLLYALEMRKDALHKCTEAKIPQVICNNGDPCLGEQGVGEGMGGAWEGGGRGPLCAVSAGLGIHPEQLPEPAASLLLAVCAVRLPLLTLKNGHAFLGLYCGHAGI